MALIGTRPIPSLDSLELPHLCFNLSTRLVRPTALPLLWNSGYLFGKRSCSSSKVKCSLSRETVSPLESQENANMRDSLEEEFSHAMKFDISDFNIHDRVSIGLGGRV